MAEQTFMNENGVYVSNTRVVIHGTTYSTANITSVRTAYTAARRGCATLLIIFGVLMLFGAIVMLFAQDSRGGAGGPLIFAMLLLIAGMAWFKSQQPTYHLVLATASGERQGLSSRDGAHVNRVTAAVADAIAYRG
ncbi:MAG TPA: DUF6232 family protein [Thermoanaerobaculia bacterium]|nr:DUF6232 family protein [Thermoanaerobaculia bacterium]